MKSYGETKIYTHITFHDTWNIPDKGKSFGKTLLVNRKETCQKKGNRTTLINERMEKQVTK